MSLSVCWIFSVVEWIVSRSPGGSGGSMGRWGRVQELPPPAQNQALNFALKKRKGGQLFFQGLSRRMAWSCFNLLKSQTS